MHFFYRSSFTFREKAPDKLDGNPYLFEPADFAYLDPSTLIHNLRSIPANVELLRWEVKFKDSVEWLANEQYKFYFISQSFISIDKWRDEAQLLIDKFLAELKEIKEKLPNQTLIEPLVRRIDLFKKALPNWSTEQVKYNFAQLLEITSQSISSAIGYSSYTKTELMHSDTECLKALTHPKHRHLQRESRAEALSLYTLGAILHSLQHMSKSSPSMLSEIGKQRFICECQKLLDCALPSHPDHLEILSKGFDLVKLALKDIEVDPRPENFNRGYYVISSTVSILQSELDYVSWRHHGTQNVFENRLKIEEKIHFSANDHHEKAKTKIELLVDQYNSFFSPISDLLKGAIAVRPSLLEILREIKTEQEARNKLIIDPAQFVRIKIFSQYIPPTRELLRQAQTIQFTRIGDDALLTVQSEKELRYYIDGGSLSFVAVTVSDQLLAFFAISTNQEKLTESGNAAIKKLSKLKRFAGASFAFVELVASDVTSRFRLKPWARGAWSFVSAAGENLALNSYNEDDRVVLALIARDGIAAENVYAGSGFVKTKQYLKLKFLGEFHKYYIWTKELGGEIVSF